MVDEVASGGGAHERVLACGIADVAESEFDL
jgi:hypothetical protein